MNCGSGTYSLFPLLSFKYEWIETWNVNSHKCQRYVPYLAWNMLLYFWCSTCPLVFGCCELSHVIFLKLRKKKLLAKLSKFTNWKLFSFEIVLGCLFEWNWFARSSFILNLRKMTWLNLQQPKTRRHVEHLWQVKSGNLAWKRGQKEPPVNLLICTLISKNQGLEKFQVLQSLIFFQVSILKKSAWKELQKFQVPHLKKNQGLQNLDSDIFLGF